jgi:hypothetical protein
MYIVNLIPQTNLIKNIFFNDNLVLFSEGFELRKFEGELFVKYDYYYESFEIYDRKYKIVKYTIEME